MGRRLARPCEYQRVVRVTSGLAPMRTAGYVSADASAAYRGGASCPRCDATRL